MLSGLTNTILLMHALRLGGMESSKIGPIARTRLPIGVGPYEESVAKSKGDVAKGRSPRGCLPKEMQ